MVGGLIRFPVRVSGFRPVYPSQIYSHSLTTERMAVRTKIQLCVRTCGIQPGLQQSPGVQWLWSMLDWRPQLFSVGPWSGQQNGRLYSPKPFPGWISSGNTSQYPVTLGLQLHLGGFKACGSGHIHLSDQHTGNSLAELLTERTGSQAPSWKWGRAGNKREQPQP